MPVSGLVVSLKSDPQLRNEAIDAIRAEPRIEIGAIKQRRMAVVLDTASVDEDKQLWCWLGSLPGVVFVDVALVGYEDPDSVSPPCNSPPSGTRSTQPPPTVTGAANHGF